MRSRSRSLLVVPGSRSEAADRRGDPGGELAPFDAGARADFWWRQPRRFRQEWRLEADGREVAAMKGEPLFSRTSRVRFSDAAYEMRRGWSGNVEVRAEGAGEPLARYVSRWSGGGRVETPAGDVLAFVPVGFWHRTHELRTEDGHVLVRLESHDGFSRHEVQVLFEDPVRRRDDLRPLLALMAAVVFAPKRHSS